MDKKIPVFNKCPAIESEKACKVKVITLTKLPTREETTLDNREFSTKFPPSLDQARDQCPAHALDHPLGVEEDIEPVGASGDEVDLTVEKVEEPISVLGRTIRDTKRTRGPELETALQRQLAVRRNQVSV